MRGAIVTAAAAAAAATVTAAAAAVEAVLKSMSNELLSNELGGIEEHESRTIE